MFLSKKSISSQRGNPITVSGFRFTVYQALVLNQLLERASGFTNVM